MKNSTIFLFNVLFLISMCCFSCKKKNTTVNIYDGCCDTAPVEKDFNPGKIYVPNMFTPNNDGRNDQFFGIVDKDIDLINVFKIYGADGSLMFQYYNITNPSNSHYAFGWYPFENDKTTYKGKFSYYYKVTNTAGKTYEFEGSACSYICDEANPFDDFSNCAFATQHNGVGKFEPSLPNFEPDCP